MDFITISMNFSKLSTLHKNYSHLNVKLTFSCRNVCTRHMFSKDHMAFHLQLTMSKQQTKFNALVQNHNGICHTHTPALQYQYTKLTMEQLC